MLKRMLFLMMVILFLWGWWMFAVWEKRMIHVRQVSSEKLAAQRTIKSLQASYDYTAKNKVKSVRVLPDTVALTFDDGPTPRYTKKILSILNKNNVKGVFFVSGQNALKYPEIVKQAYLDGHAIACHGFFQKRLIGLSQKELDREVVGCKLIIKKIIGRYPICYRPTYNETDARANAFIKLQGMVVVPVDLDSLDWKKPGVNKILKHILSVVHGGRSITFHDGTIESEDRSQTVKVLPIVIKKIKEMGLGFSRICYP
ncbi:MAG: polysaccharide deacetylase family protein [Gammaproteobacteria bacterium]|jgi:peptidoglycan/xylan/chitin deacetylase (PgdA/CDA1 family)